MNLSSSATIILNCITVEFVCTLLHENNLQIVCS